ncbi:MAG: hypothetical protein HQL56_14270 [Magnetococcales bacterium]|nr:hypothetical protein [Magnetococcales bacterium]
MTNRVLVLVPSVFGRAKEWGLWEKGNPASSIRKDTIHSRERFLDSDEMDRFRLTIEEEP